MELKQSPLNAAVGSDPAVGEIEAVEAFNFIRI
jgi:hypothetical protein